jgi:hypothetical protein
MKLKQELVIAPNTALCKEGETCLAKEAMAHLKIKKGDTVFPDRGTEQRKNPCMKTPRS